MYNVISFEIFYISKIVQTYGRKNIYKIIGGLEEFI